MKTLRVSGRNETDMGQRAELMLALYAELLRDREDSLEQALAERDTDMASHYQRECIKYRQAMVGVNHILGVR